MRLKIKSRDYNYVMYKENESNLYKESKYMESGK